MVDKGKKPGQKKYPPVNESVHYYTDPIYSTDALYGFDEESDEEKKSKEMVDSADDEPVESWGWVNEKEYE